MSSQLSDSKRIAKNTLMLYFRQILLLLISFYTIRIILNTLGAEDFGIYNVVAGVATMFTFLTGAMSVASQRYFSVDLGKNNLEQLKITFSIMLQIYFFLAIVIIVIAETLGLWFVNNKLVIPQERMLAANWIYQAAIISFLYAFITTPFNALIIAHEDMNIFAKFSIIEGVLRLATVFLLKLISFDKLIVYGIITTFVMIINTSLIRVYCYKKYAECKIKFFKDRGLFKEIITYSGWNLLGSFIGIVKNQILSVVLNLFFGPVVNAARGIAYQVNCSVNSFSQNFTTAIQPQIVKKFAAKEKSECLKLVFRGCKMTFFLMWIFTLPLCLEMPFVLRIWLKNVPDYVVLFTQLALIDALIDSINYPIVSLAQATGKIKIFQIVAGLIFLFNLPVSYILLKLKFSAYSVFYASIIITIIASIVRVVIVKKLAFFSIKDFIKNVVIPCFLVVLCSSIIPYIICCFVKNEIIEFFAVGFTSVLFTVLFILYFGLNKSERAVIFNKIFAKKGDAL